ncbi:hypothetical protein Lsha_2151 [Legionella shakespearei DSM 23087]|uniref:Uncharacterized protein n=1 Tax=Legionella shakespearei DSM 23087 TaxID=1122169 RepID=A0A0W0YLS2_9GAMM|nr:hypothetical protein Lsha_2151 [Legionella shakespearei DSM 23087]
MSANASYYAVNIDIAKEWAGTSLGIMDALFAIAGFIAPTLTASIGSGLAFCFFRVKQKARLDPQYTLSNQ